MASVWIEKGKRWRLREEIDGNIRTIVKDLGIWRDPADVAKLEYKKARARGFVPNYESKDLMADVRLFLKIHEEGGKLPDDGRSVPITELCDLYLHHHGPSLKGGISDDWDSPYHHLKYLLEVVKKGHPKHRAPTVDRPMMGTKLAEDVNMLDVRDFLSQFKTVGTRMRYLSVISHMFKITAEWNEEGILNPPVRLPANNPAAKWRSKMKPAEKRCLADRRVLSREEWAQFKAHLTARARAISEIALRRFLRLADIRQVSHLKVNAGMIEGLQEKTGDLYSVPVLENHPSRYDFTNFRKEFYTAQVAAHMDYPVGHPLHFTPRSLRRTGATWAYRETKDLVGISRMLGHQKITTTIRYLNIDDVDRAAIALAVDQYEAGGVPQRR